MAFRKRFSTPITRLPVFRVIFGCCPSIRLFSSIPIPIEFFTFAGFYFLLPKSVPVLPLFANLIAILFVQYLMSISEMLVLFAYFDQFLMHVLTPHRAAMFRT